MADDTTPGLPGAEELERQRREEEELRLVLKEKGLVATRAFIKDPKSAKTKSKVAARVARFREGQKERGLVSTAVPATVAAAVKMAGGWQQWQDGLRAATPPERPIDQQRPPPGQQAPELSAEDRRDLDLGRRVRGLVGWRARAVRWLVS